MSFEYEEALFCLEALSGEEIPGIASRMLEAGLDSQPLRELAGLTSPTFRDAGPLFEKALRLLRPEPMSHERARAIVGRRALEEIATGAVGPLAGAQEISRQWSASYYPADLSVLVYLADTVDERRAPSSEAEREIVETARALLAKMDGEPDGQGALVAYERALGRVVDVFAYDGHVRQVLDEAIGVMPDASHLRPAVDPFKVDLDKLAYALQKLWPAYLALPKPDGTNQVTKYLRLPPPLPARQRGTLDQAYRVWYSRRHTMGEELRQRLYHLICGDVGPPAGMEDYQERYHQVHMADMAREEPDASARLMKRKRL